MEETANLKLPYIMPSQAQKHVTHNEALRALDALVQLSVEDRDRTVPPAAPAEGDRHIVAAAAAGVWAGRAGQVAAWQDGGWAYFQPGEGWRAWVAQEEALCVFHGGQWTAENPGLQNLEMLGVNATADAVSRLVVASQASLFDNEDGDHRLKINKAAAGGTATVLLQSGYEGRAEIGLAGDDDLRIKLSSDGVGWRDVLRLTADGRALLPTPGPLALPDQIAARRDIRERLSADRTYHVRPDGDDGNDGLSDSAGGAFATIQRAIDVAYGLIDLGPFDVTIQLGDGTYGQSIAILAPHLGAGAITLAGNAASPQDTVMAGAGGARTITLSGGAALMIRDFELRGNGEAATFVSAGAALTVGSGMRFGAATTAHLYAQDGGVISAVGASYTITGGTGRHLLAVTGSIVNTLNCTVTLSGTPDFSNAYAQADRLSIINANNSTFIGSATGKRYDVATNGVIWTGGGDAYFPGDAAGTAAAGGQYS